MSFALTHTRALASVTRKGTAVTFSYTSDTYNGLTDVTTSVSATVLGYAVRVGGNPIRYRDLGLSLTEAPSLLVAPTTYGQAPPLGATVSWGSLTYTVRDVAPVDPDGSGSIVCTVIVVR